MLSLQKDTVIVNEEPIRGRIDEQDMKGNVVDDEVIMGDENYHIRRLPHQRYGSSEGDVEIDKKRNTTKGQRSFVGCTEFSRIVVCVTVGRICCLLSYSIALPEGGLILIIYCLQAFMLAVARDK